MFEQALILLVACFPHPKQHRSSSSSFYERISWVSSSSSSFVYGPQHWKADTDTRARSFTQNSLLPLSFPFSLSTGGTHYRNYSFSLISAPGFFPLPLRANALQLSSLCMKQHRRFQTFPAQESLDGSVGSVRLLGFVAAFFEHPEGGTHSKGEILVLSCLSLSRRGRSASNGGRR